MKNVTAKYIKAKHSLLHVVYDDIEIDLEPAILPTNSVTQNVDYFDRTQFSACSPSSKQAISAVSTNKIIERTMQEFGQYPLFQNLVRLLKYAVKTLGLSGNKIGYFGGINVVLLAANLMLISNKKLSLN